MLGLAKYDVFIDGACPFCQWVRARVEAFDTHSRLLFVDYNDSGAAARAPFTREELDREMHVRAPDGSWHAGYAAWLVLLRAMPFVRWLGTLLGSSMFRNTGLRLHHWIARNRYRLPGAPPPCLSDACPRHQQSV
jgi:predicted DCC family thiol-disulfide oxidoreductase YuxK